ncbi:MAG TPA: ribosome-associated translation inhibitor RaiA [Spirochaetota bacterium]|nr:ribosome-associated translation inhibitor RaiA [Spirochaetota bacterium]HOM38456.1 ribosome-associated translation inhibitor RaiA [Spirochaetota bacterium]HPQ48996.1 ribosome-associated translation inhibitor RaiA [Spirochaetota bacterium]
MQLQISGKNIKVTDALRSYVEKKMERIKFYFPHLIDVHVVMEVEKIIHKVEITVKSDGKIFHSEYKDQDMYSAIDNLIDRLEKQVVRYKNKLQDFESKRVTQLEEKQKEKQIKFTKVREVFLKPMSDDEAILQLASSDFRFAIYKSTPPLTEDQYNNIDTLKIDYLNSIVVKDENSPNSFSIIKGNNGKWEKISVVLNKNNIKKGDKKDKVVIKEEDLTDAVNELINSDKNYHIFYESESKSLNIIYKRKDGNLGIITGKV